MKRKRKNEMKIKIRVDTPELDEATEKANRLVCILREAITLIDSLSGQKIDLLKFSNCLNQKIQEHLTEDYK